MRERARARVCARGRERERASERASDRGISSTPKTAGEGSTGRGARGERRQVTEVCAPHQDVLRAQRPPHYAANSLVARDRPALCALFVQRLFPVARLHHVPRLGHHLRTLGGRQQVKHLARPFLAHRLGRLVGIEHFARVGKNEEPRTGATNWKGFLKLSFKGASCATVS